MKNNFIRIIVSLILGGAITELIHISTGDPNRPQEHNFSIFFAIIFYVAFTINEKRKSKI